MLKLFVEGVFTFVKTIKLSSFLPESYRLVLSLIAPTLACIIHTFIHHLLEVFFKPISCPLGSLLENSNARQLSKSFALCKKGNASTAIGVSWQIITFNVFSFQRQLFIIIFQPLINFGPQKIVLGKGNSKTECFFR